MSYDELKQLCRKSTEEKYKYLCIEISKNRDQGRDFFCNESKSTYIEGTLETTPF